MFSTGKINFNSDLNNLKYDLPDNNPNYGSNYANTEESPERKPKRMDLNMSHQ